MDILLIGFVYLVQPYLEQQILFVHSHSFDFKWHPLMRENKPGFKDPGSTCQPCAVCHMQPVRHPVTLLLFMFHVPFYSFHMYSCCCPFGMAGMFSLSLHWDALTSYSCFAVHFLNIRSAMIGKIAVIAQPWCFSFKTKTAEGAFSFLLAIINCGMFTPASTDVTG